MLQFHSIFFIYKLNFIHIYLLSIKLLNIYLCDIAPEGGWFKKELPKAACAIMNAHRPSPSLSNELNSNEDVVEDMFSDVVKCESKGNQIDCVFLSPNVFMPY